MLENTILLLLLIDYLLIFFKVKTYFKLSLPIMYIPKRFNRINIDQILTEPDIISYGKDLIYCYPKSIFSHVGSVMILMKPNGVNKVKGKILFTPIKIVFLIFLILFYLFNL